LAIGYSFTIRQYCSPITEPPKFLTILNKRFLQAVKNYFLIKTFKVILLPGLVLAAGAAKQPLTKTNR
jgi:hypothetical protein